MGYNLELTSEVSSKVLIKEDVWMESFTARFSFCVLLDFNITLVFFLCLLLDFFFFLFLRILFPAFRFLYFFISSLALASFFNLDVIFLSPCFYINVVLFSFSMEGLVHFFSDLWVQIFPFIFHSFNSSCFVLVL